MWKHHTKAALFKYTLCKRLTETEDAKGRKLIVHKMHIVSKGD
jgi:hypothetical protein